MPSASGHFCPHGNLRYACALCRAERQAARGPVERKTYGRPLGPGGKVPATPWRMDDALAPHEEDALRAAAGRDGVVVLPAPLGLRRVAFALLRGLRHDVDGIVFVVPSAKAVGAWAAALSSALHVPSEDVDDEGRAVRDWARLRTVTLWTPETLLRNRSGLRQHAPRLALFVDSPESAVYGDVADAFALPFARRLGVSAARFVPPSPAVWGQLDALGGVIHRLDVADAIRAGILADVHHSVEVVRGSGGAAERAAMVVSLVAGAGETARCLVWVDDSETGRAVEEAAARAGLGARFVPGTATPELAERAARVVREGGARVLVVAVDAPEVAPGVVDVVVRAADSAGPGRSSALLLAQLASRTGRVRLYDVVPERPAAVVDAPALAGRLVETAAVSGARLPVLGWLAEAFPVRPLPDALAAQVAERAPSGWQAVQGLLSETVEAGFDAGGALVSLADAYVGAVFHLRGGSLASWVPAIASDATALAGPFARAESLVGLALLFDEARAAWGALLRGDALGLVAAYAGAPLLHHLAPDLRRLLVATAEDVRAARLPELDAGDPIGAARLVAERGGDLPRPQAAPGAPPEPVAVERHVERLVAALAAEQALDVAENVEEIQRLSAGERERQGRTLVGLELVSKQRTDGGLELRYGREVRPGGERPELPYTEASPGSLVDLSSGLEYDPVTRGSVSAVTTFEVRVVVEEDRERRAPGRECRLDVVGNPRVYDTLARGVRVVYGPGGLASGGAGGLRDLLLQRAPASPPEAVEGRFFAPRLNPSQMRAVASCLGAAHLALVHGPPGTGKTTTLAEYILQEAVRGHRVLVVADSNAAVDAVMEACLHAGVVGVRTGPRPSLTRARLAPFHLDTLSGRAPGVDWLRRLPVVFTTHVSSASLPREALFDVVVQDEASQATEPASCLSLARAPKLVLAGDHLQLPPVVRASEAERLGLGRSLFERLHAAYGATLGTLLSVQYRMHGDIEAWSNRTFYAGRIETAVDPEPMTAAVAAGVLPASPRALFVDVVGREASSRTSKEREVEAEWVAGLVRRLLGAGVRPASVAVIAAYRAQVRLLRRLLEGSGVDVGTIDAFQGSERDIVVVSLVRGNPRGEVGFVRDPRRLNVAMTRARRHLVVVGDASTLSAEPLLADLVATLGVMRA